MTIVRRMFNKGLFVIVAMTALLLLAGIIVLPGLGATYTDLAQSQARQPTT
jgi:hypothetical protein